MKKIFYSVGETSIDYYSNAGTINYELQRNECTKCGNIRLEPVMPPFDYVIEGKRLGDIMGITPGYYLVSLKTYELFESNNISGVSFSRSVKCVKWIDRKGAEIVQPIPEYVYMIIEGKCGDVFLSNGYKLQRCPICNSLNSKYMGVKTAFNIDNWDGSDIFTHTHATGMMCTEKVKDIIEKNKLKNFDLRPCRCTSKTVN